LLKKKRLKLNLGCGSTKLEGYINVDSEKSCKPDLICDFIKSPLPYKQNSIEEIVLFHTIEHIQKGYHQLLLERFYNLLVPGGKLYISYPNFWICAQYWKDNYQGKRDFWHATMFGRQLYPADFHVCAMDPKELEFTLKQIGFRDVRSKPEPQEVYNSITFAVAGEKTNFAYEDVVRDDLERMVVNK
jgi:hypothetical protein